MLNIKIEYIYKTVSVNYIELENIWKNIFTNAKKKCPIGNVVYNAEKEIKRRRLVKCINIVDNHLYRRFICLICFFKKKRKTKNFKTPL